MSTPDLRNTFQNELRRVLIQNHPNFAAWYAQLGPCARQIVDSILEEDISPPLILLAQEAPPEEWKACRFLEVIAGSNPSPDLAVALTNFALNDILLEVRQYKKTQQ